MTMLATVETSPYERSPEYEHQQQCRLLIVEDSVAERIRLCSMLGKLGYHIVEFGNGAAALEILQNQSIDIVISDWRMPCMDGFSLCKEIQQQFEVPPYFILLTNTLEKVTVLVLWRICFRHLSPQQIWQVLTGKLQLFGRDTRIADGATEDQKTLPWIAAYQKVPEGAISPARLVYPDCREFETLTLAEIELHHPRSIQSLAIYARMALKCPRRGTLRQNNPTPIIRG